MKFNSLLVAAALWAGTGALCFGQIAGHVKVDGKVPDPKPIDMSSKPECDSQHPDPATDETIVVDDKNNLANVVVSIQPDEGLPLPAGDAGSLPTAVIDQKGCQYSPHVLAVEVGQKIDVKNDDPLQHNIHSLAEKNATFNQAQSKGDVLHVDPMKVAETFKIKCDVHAWMGATVVVFEHPYFAVSAADGSYSIPTKDLPDGDYNIVAWQEKFGKSDPIKVTVKDGKADKAADFTFKADAGG
jgi:plastocyanin